MPHLDKVVHTQFTRQSFGNVDLSLVQSTSKIMPHPDGEVEEEKAKSPLVDDDATRSSPVTRVDSNGEWKNVQPLLTNLGLKLFPTPKEIKLSRNSFKSRRIRGSRELQNLQFNVNYNRSDCSKGKSTFL